MGPLHGRRDPFGARLGARAVAKESELEAPGVTKPWSMPPVPTPPQGLAPLPPVPGPVPPPVEAAAVPPSARSPITFEDFASRMGREIVKVSPLFRIGAVLILCGALVLAAENAMIFTSTVGQIGGAMNAFQDPGNNTSASGTGNAISNMQGYFAMLTVATQLDVIGFGALGGGSILLGIGSLGLVFRHRFDGEERRPSKTVLIFGLASGAFALLWVMYTTQWRTGLTGSSTGDWSFVPHMFNVQDWIQSRGVPTEVNDFVDTFPRISQNWLYAAVMQVPAALCFYLMGWRIKKETGIRVGGASWVVFSILALIGTALFIAATIGALMAASHIDFSNPDSWSGSITQVALQLGVAAATKLLFVPLWATISFAILSIAGIKLMMIKPGKVTMSDSLLKQILKAQPAAEGVPDPAVPMTTMLGAPAPAALGAPPQAAMSTSLPTRQDGDVVVSLMGPPTTPPPAAPSTPPPQPPKS